MERARAVIDRIDWFRVLVDLRRTGRSYDHIGRILEVPANTICRWSGGVEPKHRDGVRLLELWAAVMGRDVSDAPWVREVRAPR